LTLVLIAISATAQQGINYKALIKDSSGNVIANDLIQVQFTILQGVGLTSVYQETHSPTTDANGIIIINIGEGTPVSGDFNSIDWASDTHLLKTEVNTGSGLVDMGITQFMAVPYALQAETATTASNVTGLESLDEGNGFGWRLIGQNPDNYGNIGSNAVDLSYSTITSSTRGATGERSRAIGSSTTASGNISTAMGNGTLALGDLSTAMGANTVASGNFSTAIGNYTIASGNYSTAMGKNTIASYAATSFGRYNVGGGSNTSWEETDPLFEIGNGTSSILANAFTVLKNGSITAPSFDLAEITDDKALITKEYLEANGSSGLEAIDEGNGIGWRLIGQNPDNYGNIGKDATDLSYSYNASSTGGATGSQSTAMGFDVVASNQASIAMGRGTEASGSQSTAMGSSTLASGSASTAMGSRTLASAVSSTAMGEDTVASGFYSTAMGDGTTASEIASTAMGRNTTASAFTSTAMGFQTTASGYNATTMGRYTIASGDSSIAMGNNTTASYNVTSLGRYNIGGGSDTNWAATDALFEIGNGSSDVNRSNALTILKNGNLGIGTPTPNVKLHILGGSDASLVNGSGYIVNGPESNTNMVIDENEIQVRYDGTPTTLYLQNEGGSLRIGGAVYVNGSVVHTSDRRLKKDINTINYGLDEILALTPVSYNWKNRDQDYKSLGLIAQDVQPIIKEIVHQNNLDNNMLSVSYTELIPVLIKAIQEQQEIIENQDSKIVKQNSEIKTLISELSENMKAQFIKEETQNRNFKKLLKRVEQLENISNQ